MTTVKNVVYDTNGILGAIRAPFSYTTFPTKGFSNLKQVDIAIIQSEIGQVATEVFLDNVSYDAIVAK